MGMFSFMKADELTKIANIMHDAPFKFLIPKEFVTEEFEEGYISDCYQGYGKIGSKNGKPRFDAHELLAMWNADKVKVSMFQAPNGMLITENEYKSFYTLVDYMLKYTKDEDKGEKYRKWSELSKYEMDDFKAVKVPMRKVLKGKIVPMKEINKHTEENRSFGIDLFYSDEYLYGDCYKLKFVSSSYKGTYEDCKGFSVNDPEQGCVKIIRK